MKVTLDRRIVQFAKFCMVGVLNTLVTLCAIFVCKSLLGVNAYVSNAIGYVLGVINSFLWNRRWVFHSSGRVHSEALRFALGFVFCYALQLTTVVVLNTSPFGAILIDLGPMTISGYGLATIIGCGVYTLTNFIYNRIVTFHHR